MDYAPIKIREKFAQFDEQWSPKVIAELNDYQFKLARLEGEFVWHQHVDTDEAFLVISGQMTIELRDGQVLLETGDLYVVPRGVEHRSVAKTECQVLIIVPRGVVNTGTTGGELTAPDDVWI
ncbi:MAG: cupin domain-containing protein [Gammaproteobacteria bacterium]